MILGCLEYLFMIDKQSKMATTNSEFETRPRGFKQLGVCYHNPEHSLDIA